MPLVLVDGLDLAGSPASAGWLAGSSDLASVTLVGGVGVITAEVASGLDALLSAE
jgi:hypothetical protein